MEAAANLIEETQDEKAPIKKAREKLVGKEIILVGRVNYNDFSDQIEFIIDEIP